jgi:acyl-CoA oxidase
MMMIGQRLFTGRVAVAQCALAFTRRLLESTRAYSDGKMCWGPKGDTNLTKVPQLSALYKRADKKLQRLDSYVAECQSLLSVHLRNETVPPLQLQDAIACAKIAATETSIDICFRLSQDVGSFALMRGKGFGETHFLQACKFAEGDSRILMQKLARDRLKFKKEVGSEKEQNLAAQLRQVAGQGQQAWDEHFEEVYDLAWAMVTRIIDTYTPGETLGVPAGISKM